jgi:hypothetical protein
LARREALAAVRAGYELHYPGQGGPGDRELLDGDRLYAQGLAALAAAGDLEGVRVLAELITACARTHAEGRPSDADVAWREATSSLS